MNARWKRYTKVGPVLSLIVLILSGCPPPSGDGIFVPGAWGFTIVPDEGEVRQAGRMLLPGGTTSDFFYEGANLIGDMSWAQVGDQFQMLQDAGLGLDYAFVATVVDGTRLSGTYSNWDTPEQGTFTAIRVGDNPNEIGPNG